MIITISGPAGSGKGTIAKMLAEHFGYDKFSTGDFRRLAAKDKGMTIEEFNKLGESDSSTDLIADEYQRKLGLEKDDFVIDARLAWYFIPHSIKLYLYVSDNVAAERIFADNSQNRINQTKVHSIEQQKQLCIERNKSDLFRYKNIYGIENFTDPKHYDLVIDTSYLTPQEIFDKILDFISTHDKSSKHNLAS